MKDFDAWYLETLRGPLTVLEHERRALARKVTVAWGALASLGAGGGAWIYGWPLDASYRLEAGFAMVAVLGLAGAACLQTMSVDYRRRFKAKVLPAVIDTLGEGMRHLPNRAVPQGVFEAANFYPGRTVAGYTGEDLIVGEVAGKAVQMGEIEVTWAVALTKSDKVTKGWLIAAPSASEAPGRVLVVSSGQALFKPFWSKQASAEPAVDMGHAPAFAKSFRVYARDAEGARRLLTPGMQRRLTALREKAGHAVLVCFREETLYGYFPSAGAFLEPPVFTPLHDAGPLKRQLAVLHAALALMQGEGVEPAASGIEGS